MKIYTPEEWAAHEAAEETKVSIGDYDAAMENHLRAERDARGYTMRSPIEYTNSKNPRWAADAADWQAHLDEVMTYGLNVMNLFAAGEPIPDLQTFTENLPKITWSFDQSAQEE